MLVKSLFSGRPFDVAREMDRLFDSMASAQPFGLVPAACGQRPYPPLNLWEDDANAYVEAEVPGMAMDDLEVLVTDEELTLTGTRGATREDAQALRRERPTGSFERTISLPVAIDADRVEARLADGVLSVTLPKVAASKPRRVAVRALPDAG